MRIEGIHLVEKRGGKSGVYRAKSDRSKRALRWRCSPSPTRSPACWMASTPLPAEQRAARRSRRPRARRGSHRAPHPAAGRRLRHGRLCGARRRRRQRVPAHLTLIGEVAAGPAVRRRASAQAKPRASSPAACCRAGADTVVIQENTEREGDTVVVQTPAPRGKNVRVAGLDFQHRRCAPEEGPPPDRARCRARRRDEPPDACRSIAARRSRSSRPATSWCRPAPSRGPARSSTPTSSRSPRLRGAKAPR